ncbi:E3 ubiquitin-protein ligase APD2-like isoform X1 [Salvia splendens]|uniref:E3 ubiquitin-protein ligase APD2-like isoform X1 n=1 Tax=Salvia splendens TaxID=180675 RepID=UPI001C25611F|nr:E3 ubiquitin-protein ligase APD2-like isoform X1 [Salvia splendens]
MAEVEQPESPPRPFPARSPEFPRDQFHADRFSQMYNGTSSMHNGATSANADDPKSCFIASTTFSFFVAITMAFGLYSPEHLRLGPNASILIQPNTLFVESIEVVEVGAAKSSMLFGFYEVPALDVMVTWQETHKISLPSNTHKEWVHYLNGGSQINVSYSVTSWGFSSIGLVIAQGNAELAEWLKDPSYPNTTFSWNIIHVIVAENGSIQKDILKSSAYYTGVGNLNPEISLVDLNMSIKASMYDTTKPYYKCRPADGKCTFPLFFMGANAVVLTSPGQVPGIVNGNCYVKISYGPRWIAYVVVAGGLILLMLLFNYFTNHLRRTEQDMPSNPPVGIGSERNPLLLQKDDDTSASEGGDHEGDAQAGVEANPVKGDEDCGHTCAICFEAPKDSFFIPCGHCVACFGCANRIVETSATCPICRGKTKKAKKIYTV